MVWLRNPGGLGVLDTCTNALQVVDTDPATGPIYAVLSDINHVAKITTDPAGQPRILSTVPSVRQPNSIALDTRTGTVYVAGNVDPALQVIPASAFAPG